ncbi:aminopeptidase P family protein [Gammaproteobacteria bacterium]|nr:aminopeptidase P family protein [Gammaproteobacteria bacterium]
MTEIDKVNKIRAEMRSECIDAYMIPMRNNFLDNDLKSHEMRIKYISKFSGSAGQIFIASHKAAIFIDGRYTLQAKLEVNQKIFEINEIGLQNYTNWIEKNLPKNCIVGYDPKLFSMTEIKNYEKKFENHNVILKSISSNLVDRISLKSPSQKKLIISDHKIKYSGATRAEKLGKLRDNFIKNQEEVIFIGDCNFISWLTNLRAYRKKYNPVIPAYCLVTMNNCHLFIESCSISSNVATKISNDIKIHDMKDFERDITSLVKNKNAVRLDKEYTTIFVQEIFKKLNIQISHQHDINHGKAIKNTVELQSFKKAHKLDALAVCNFLYWIKKQEHVNNFDELRIVDSLERFRKEQKPYYLGPSFPAIVGFNENGAVIHYSATKKTNKTLSGNGLLLIDSGGQYKYGTTDVTRTIQIGKASKQMKKLYTIVLKAHIALARASFSQNTTGAELDNVARSVIRKYGYDYNHGTGHGVGSVLSVHDGILSISPREKRSNFQENMVFSNEPGIYIEGLLGIRIENLMALNKDKKIKNNLCFETITHIPFERELLDLNILSKSELDWINEYHSDVYEKLKSKLRKDEREWLKNTTRPI